jgi:Zn-dependent peptidase ImmA (M78 family)
MKFKSKVQIEEQANQILRRTDCLRVPVPVELVAHRLSLRVEPAALGEDVSGVLVVSDGMGTIGYNTSQALVRQRFSIAHEIGHFELHQETGPGQLFIDKTYIVYRRDQRSSNGEYLQEIQANQFAAALLMPEELLRLEVAHIGFDLADESTLDALAEKFQVSRQAMSFRLSKLNIL